MAGISAGRPTPFRGRSYLDSGIGLDLAEKAVQKPDIALWILHVGHVRAARQDHRTGPGDALSDRPVDRRRRLVVLARGDERRHSDLPETLGDVPLAQRAGDVEFAWPVHRPVDEPVPLDEVERAQHILGPLVQTADVPLVEDQAGVLVLLQIGRPRLLVPAQRLLHIFRELGAETTLLGDPLRNARRRARQDEARKAGRLRERVLHGEHPAPRAPEEVDPVEPELAPDGADLVHEQLDRVEGRILGEIGLPAAELVVEDRAPARPGERLERLEVVMRRTRPAVEEPARGASLSPPRRRRRGTRPRGRKRAASPRPRSRVGNGLRAHFEVKHGPLGPAGRCDASSSVAPIAWLWALPASYPRSRPSGPIDA